MKGIFFIKNLMLGSCWIVFMSALPMVIPLAENDIFISLSEKCTAVNTQEGPIALVAGVSDVKMFNLDEERFNFIIAELDPIDQIIAGYSYDALRIVTSTVKSKTTLWDMRERCCTSLYCDDTFVKLIGALTIENNLFFVTDRLNQDGDINVWSDEGKLVTSFKRPIPWKWASNIKTFSHTYNNQTFIIFVDEWHIQIFDCDWNIKSTLKRRIFSHDDEIGKSVVVIDNDAGFSIITGSNSMKPEIFFFDGNQISCLSKHNEEEEGCSKFSDDSKVSHIITVSTHQGMHIITGPQWLSLSKKNKIKIWNMNGEIVKWFHVDAHVKNLIAAFGTAYGIVLMTAGNKRIDFWDEDGYHLMKFGEHSAELSAIRVTRGDEKFNICSIYEDGGIAYTSVAYQELDTWIKAAIINKEALKTKNSIWEKIGSWFSW